MDCLSINHGLVFMLPATLIEHHCHRCRLLRNRVSAQQARERKKSYVSNLEQRAREQEQTITEMEQRVIKLERENAMLRSVMKNMQPTSAPSAYMQQGNFGGVPQGPAGGYGTRLDNFGF